MVAVVNASGQKVSAACVPLFKMRKEPNIKFISSADIQLPKRPLLVEEKIHNVANNCWKTMRS